MGIWSKTLILNGTEIKVCDMTKGNGSTFKTCGVDSIPDKIHGSPAALVNFDDCEGADDCVTVGIDICRQIKPDEVNSLR